jgi:regulator of sigma E protease
MLGYVVICLMGVVIGMPRALNVVQKVRPGTEAQKIGLRPGDRIVSIGATRTNEGDAMIDLIHASLGKQLLLSVERGGQTIKLVATPQVYTDDSGKPIPEDGKLVGILGFEPRQLYIHQSLGESVKDGTLMTGLWFKALAQIVATHQIRQHTGGPIFIAKTTEEEVDSPNSIPNLVALLAQLSLSLAIFNLLPIPILDGGHLLIFAIEALRRGRRLTLQQQQNFMMTGLAIIGTLVILVMYNDILRLIHHTLQ